jgi:hypothetical protein
VFDANVAIIIDSEFFGNRVFDDGGGLVFDRVEGVAIVDNCNFTENVAGAMATPSTLSNTKLPNFAFER